MAMYYNSNGRPVINSGTTALHSGFIVRMQGEYDHDGRRALLTPVDGENIALKPTRNIMSESMQSLLTGTIGAVLTDEYREQFGFEPLENRDGKTGFVPVVSNVLGLPVKKSGVKIYANQKKHNEALADEMCDNLNYAGIIGDTILVAMEDKEAPRVTSTQIDVVRAGTFMLPSDTDSSFKVFHPLGKHIVTDETRRADGRLSVKEISVDSFGRKMLNDLKLYERLLKDPSLSPGGILKKGRMNTYGGATMTRSEKIGHMLEAGLVGVILHFLYANQGKDAKKLIDELEELVKTGEFGTTGSSFSEFIRPKEEAWVDESSEVSYCRNNGLDMIFKACAMRANADRPVMIATNVKKATEKSAGCLVVDGIFSAI